MLNLGKILGHRINYEVHGPIIAMETLGLQNREYRSVHPRALHALVRLKLSTVARSNNILANWTIKMTEQVILKNLHNVRQKFEIFVNMN